MRQLRTTRAMAPLILCTACALSALASCGTTARQATRAPVDAGGEHATTWSYVAARYDANGDGAVAPHEYGRGSFHRLDRDRNGLLEASDFAPVDPEIPMRAMGAELLVAWYFQDDEAPHRLRKSELAAAFAAYDTGGDGLVDAEEFGCAAEPRRALGQPPMIESLREAPAFGMLLAVLDADADERLALGELTAFFDLRDDGDGVWISGDAPAASAGRNTGELSGPSFAREGQPAPDFELERLDGGGRVRLSDFIDDRPVALIFGSYT